MLEVATEKQTIVETVFISETGPVRTHNEDRVAVAKHSDHCLPSKGTLLIVADGMGGMEAGERASSMVVADIPNAYFASNIPNAVESLVQSFVQANRKVYEENERLPHGRGMGTTVVASAIVHEWLITVNVGDSRAYLFRKGKMRQLTRDHSLRKELFNPFDGEAHDFSHVLTQAIGPNANINPHVNISRVAEGDIVLLCSDGLTSVVPDVEIADVLSTASFGDVPNELLTRVLEKNGDDNVSIVLARVVDVLPLNCSQC